MKLGILAKEALDFAIENEEQSIQFYEDMAARTERPEMRLVFESLAKEERGHKSRLEAILKRGDVPSLGKKVLKLNLSDYVPDVQDYENLDYRESLVVGMKKETAAQRLYIDLAREVEEEDLRDTFRFLAEEEAKHRLRFEREYSGISDDGSGAASERKLN